VVFLQKLSRLEGIADDGETVWRQDAILDEEFVEVAGVNCNGGLALSPSGGDVLFGGCFSNLVG
jgi:hypothetical protein